MRWTVSSSDFSQRPTVLITASTDGRFGHQALLETLRVIEAGDVDRLQLLIPFVRTKLDGDGTIRDGETMQAVEGLMGDFVKVLNA